ncbi:MAG: 50S ribosomal protein L10 [Microthrixaceae bacterium]|jgi:large subunit ribosomal protein L10|nr:50S ribosomal protein L10 [Actinomycetota bacterium]MBP6728162.1 50S ribosomal protein L10 [Microthrixaceae bacterium]HMS15154.1 50S ribosomal protein L10 [Microthrixaceae bacterium]HMT25974.1 50S ribosomal protein L10 [Microthrixaceae bacterium]HMT61750.1 50S ribosomal protein L10 [Microthrixaceae bacterium]
MENPRPEKAAVVAEVKERLGAADAVLITEYRGLTVRELAGLRNAMRPAGGEYKVYKNTLVRIAARELGINLDDVLVGPTALALITAAPDGTPADIASVAKAVLDFAKTQPLLVLKGGVLGQNVLDANGAKALASLPTAAEVYARLAGAINGNARGLASVVSGVHRSLAYVLQAAIDAKVFAEGDAPAPTADAAAPAADEPAAEAASADEVAVAAAESAPDSDTPTAAIDAADESEN